MRHFAKNSIVGRPDYQDSYKQKRKILEGDDAMTLFWRSEAFWRSDALKTRRAEVTRADFN